MPEGALGLPESLTAEERAESHELEPGSFRDPASRVFHGPDAVFRALTPQGFEDWRAVSATRFFQRARAEGAIVATDLLEGPAEVPLPAAETYVALLRHERIPFVSYPYEWCFGMLKDAALLELELLLAGLDEDVTLKDGTPYNVQWRGTAPVFIDVGSLERLREGEPWAGYRQFCMLFLYPLFLQAYKDLPFQPWLRGSLDGISPGECRSLMSLRDLLRPGVFTHVHLHARLERRHGVSGGGDVKRELRAAGFGKELLRANARKLARVVGGLEWTPPASPWSGYEETKGYSAADDERKEAFVREAVRSVRPGLVWDLGCNVGRYARIAAESGAYVVAMDADRAVVERLYRSLRGSGSHSILPLAVDLADPSPGLGWRERERKPLPARGKPDLTLCLALLHHLALARNIPLEEIVGWLAALETSLVVEFVTRDDPMARRLLSGKREGLHSEYELELFERCLAESFVVERREPLASGSRILYLARPRR